ncbi:MAG: serine/threonine protein kinase [Cobetia sp.]|uniref:protein kinase domain-containing protein n=1 Tax=Cobetia sp. TaxID=1873876 RepID=UPI000C6608BF|nr:protein kinase [Cobetia sp.]MBF10282.1 serine/threonine protein kinase [Cobetia sp.]HBJ27807.1 serine/threonine protein kinase [Cobetia sp.]
MSDARAHERLQQFYIPEEQSIYLLSHHDAKKLKDWVALCIAQLEGLGYRDIHLVGKGAYGFVFAGWRLGEDQRTREEHVFKFTRVTLPQALQDRLEEEAYMLDQVAHPLIPRLVSYQRVRRQSILVMQRAPGINLEEYSLRHGRMSPRLVVKIASQLADILKSLRGSSTGAGTPPVVHGDIKPSNLVFDVEREQVALIDWGSSVFAQLDEHQQFITTNVMQLMSDNLQQTNARLGDVYFIGEEQLNGALSSPRFDEQGVAATLYALASGQSCRFGVRAIPAVSLGLPREFARLLDGMLADDPQLRMQAGDYFLREMGRISRLVMPELPLEPSQSLLPVWVRPATREIDTVVYTSRKSFLREAFEADETGEHAGNALDAVNDVQLDRYYKNFMQGMGGTEKAFLAAVSRLGKYPIVGGLAIRWEPQGIFVDTALHLHDPAMKAAFVVAINNMVALARAIYRQGVFKACLFNARDTLHLEREDPEAAFVFAPTADGEARPRLSYEVSAVPELEDDSRVHSYFEDGPDPEELLVLPKEILKALESLNAIHHTGMLIFEALPHHLKIHSYYRLLDPSREREFARLLAEILDAVPLISGLGISGFMKMPYKNTKHFDHIEAQPERFYPRDPRAT